MERAPPVSSFGQVVAGALRQLTGAELLLVLFLVALILVSVVGNCLVCVAIFTDRRLRKLGNAFIVSLAIADLFVSCLVMTFALCNELLTYWFFGDWFCDLWISFDIMCSTASILNLCAISLDRFVHIKDCLLYNQWMTRRVAISAVIIIWFTSALVSIVPINLGWHRPHNTLLNDTGGAQTASSPIGIPQPLELVERKLDYWRPIENQSSLPAGRFANTRRPAPTDFVTPSALASSGRRSSWPHQAHFNQTLSNRRDGSQQVVVADHQQQHDELPVCVLTLTPTYAVVSSAISFYIPCLIMLGLYTKLFACARRHVRNIQAISKAPAPLARPPEPAALGALEASPHESLKSQRRPTAWLSFKQRRPGAKPAPVEPTLARVASCHSGPTAGSTETTRSSPAPSSCLTPEQLPFINNSAAGSRPLVRTAPDTDPPSDSLDETAAAAKGKALGLNPVPVADNQLLQDRHPQQQQQQQQQSGQLATHKAAVTLGIIMGTFLFCWVPFFCLNVIKAFCVNCIPSSVFRAFTWLGYANSALNPIIYGIHNTEFRCAFNRIFFKHLNFKNSRYYLNRRLSFDLRHSSRRSTRRLPPAATKEPVERQTSTRSAGLKSYTPDTP